MGRYRIAPAYELPHWPAPPRPQRTETHDLVIAGGGLAGLTLACDLAQRGVSAVLLDDDDTVGARGASSRGICYAQKSLEIFDRLGIYERIQAKGVSWSVGNTYSGDERVWSFNLQAGSVSRQPPFINLQQFYIEWFLVERIAELGGVELRWKHALTGINPEGDHVRVDVQCPQGVYTLLARWLIDATGANSPIRTQLGLDAHASRSTDRWCISDVRFTKPLQSERPQADEIRRPPPEGVESSGKATLTRERRTWIDAPFNEGRAVWQHPMADDVWRMDYQMAEGADPEAVSRPEVAGERLSAQLGDDTDFEFVWIGPYQYRDHLLERFRHGRVIFIGDAAHVVSPFGARGGNSGIQDANNLGWKLAWVVNGWAGEELLDSYHVERHAAATENLTVSRRTARFLAPRSPMEHLLRRAAIGLAREHAFARTLVNAGRMSVANDYPPHALLPGGGRTVQNLVMHRGHRGQPGDGGPVSMMELLRGAGSRGLRLCFGAPDGSSGGAADVRFLDLRVAPAASPGIDLQDRDGLLAEHLGVSAEQRIVRVRPDAYRAVLAP